MTTTLVNATLSIIATHLWEVPFFFFRLCRRVSKPVRIILELFSIKSNPGEQKKRDPSPGRGVAETNEKKKKEIRLARGGSRII